MSTACLDALACSFPVKPGLRSLSSGSAVCEFSMNPYCTAQILECDLKKFACTRRIIYLCTSQGQSLTPYAGRSIVVLTFSTEIWNL